MDCTAIPCDKYATAILSVKIPFNNEQVMHHYPYCEKDMEHFSTKFAGYGYWTRITELPTLDSE
jgi:hypothetical protein